MLYIMVFECNPQEFMDSVHVHMSVPREKVLNEIFHSYIRVSSLGFQGGETMQRKVRSDKP
jgi:hypothetical protein